MVWDPKRIARKDWADVVAFYRYLEDRNDDFRPLRALSEHIAAQPYATSLSAAVSGTSLLVTRRAGADWGQDGLRIDVGLSASVCFTLQQRGAAKLTRLELESQDVAALVRAFEGFLAKNDWG
jgi:hypothetical protein